MGNTISPKQEEPKETTARPNLNKLVAEHWSDLVLETKMSLYLQELLANSTVHPIGCHSKGPSWHTAHT